MLEKDIEKKLKKPIKAMGGLCLKFTTPGFTGVPDRLILLPGGHVLFAETKRFSKKERPRQEFVQGVLRNLGFVVFSTVDTIQKVDEIIEFCRRLLR